MEPHFPIDEEREAGEFEVGYLCLFCGDEVDAEATDFCELNFSAVGGFGTFTCHVGCLREAAHDRENFPDIDRPAQRPPDYEPPDPEFLAAWDELAEVLGQIESAELADAHEVRSLMGAIEDAAGRHGIEIVHYPADNG